MPGLMALRHRLAEDATSRKLAAIQAIHAASLRASDPAGRQAGPHKQETPGTGIPEASTDHEPVREVPGGCSAKCA